MNKKQQINQLIKEAIESSSDYEKRVFYFIENYKKFFSSYLPLSISVSVLKKLQETSWSEEVMASIDPDDFSNDGSDPGLKKVKNINFNLQQTMIVALEFGYSQCEKWKNLEEAIYNFNEITNQNLKSNML